MANKDFFLDPDEAQTMGDIKFMRRSVKVRHTFPKNLANPNGLESVKEVSSLSENSLNNPQNNKQESPSFSPQLQTKSSSIPKSIPSSNNMDMFRNMAKNIGKK